MLLSSLALLVAAAPAAGGSLWAPVATPEVAQALQADGLAFVEGTRVDPATGQRWLEFEDAPGARAALLARGLPVVATAAPPPPPSADGYHSPEEAVAVLDALAAAHPARVQRVDLGESVEGRPIAGVRISATDAPALRWRVLGAHHGDERPSGELALALAARLAEAYGRDPALTALLDRDAVWVVPHVNPDGVAAVSRTNARSVDLNRNYDFEWSASESRSGSGPFSEPEARAVRALSDHTAFGAGLSVHAGAANLGWVWNFTTEAAPDEPLVAQLAAAYADACAQPGFWITNGADWYPTRGDTNDWSYGRHGTLDFTLEVSVDKQPDFEEVADIVADHLPAVEAWLAAPHAVWGRVVDAETGLPVPATVTLAEGRPLIAGWDGAFGRPVASSEPVAATARAPGYAPRAVTLEVGAGAEIALEPESLAELAPQPAIHSAGEVACFALPGVPEEGSVRLTRPGHPSLAVTPADCGWQVAGALAPGPWTLEADGAVAPRALFAGADSDATRVDAVVWSGDSLTVEGDGFVVGARAWGLSGRARSPVSLPLRSWAPDHLVLDASAVADAESWDLVLVSGGAWWAVRDAGGAAWVDTGAPDAGDGTDESGYGPGVSAPGAGTDRGCQATPGAPLAALAASMLLAVARRRETP